jgi:DNA-binding MarR family transcriptional regulator
MPTAPEVDNTPISADDVPIPALLRAARGGYAHAVRARLAAAGFEDLPRNGAYILGGIVNRGGTAGDLVRQLGVSKQAASQLIDTLVVRGYLDREVNPEDRRRVTVVVTERGRAAAAAVGAGVEAIDEELATLISPGELAALRGGLIALCDIRDRLEEAERAGADITDEY